MEFSFQRENMPIIGKIRKAGAGKKIAGGHTSENQSFP